jgi:hypothetical protein
MGQENFSERIPLPKSVVCFRMSRRGGSSAGLAELADAMDSKSIARKGVPVQVRDPVSFLLVVSWHLFGLVLFRVVPVAAILVCDVGYRVRSSGSIPQNGCSSIHSSVGEAICGSVGGGPLSLFSEVSAAGVARFFHPFSGFTSGFSVAVLSSTGVVSGGGIILSDSMISRPESPKRSSLSAAISYMTVT